MDNNTLQEILKKHIAWLSGEEDGIRANLRGANLHGVGAGRGGLGGLR